MEKKENEKESPILKTVKGLMPYVLTPAMLVYIIWVTAEYKTRSEQVQFDTPTQKLEHIMHVNNSVEELEHFKALKSIDSVLQAQRDYQRETSKRRKIQDSLDLLDKATIYQMKQAIEQINNKINND